jgi:hypothetical protein
MRYRYEDLHCHKISARGNCMHVIVEILDLQMIVVATRKIKQVLDTALRITDQIGQICRYGYKRCRTSAYLQLLKRQIRTRALRDPLIACS